MLTNNVDICEINNNSYTGELSNLWHLVFEDSKEYIDFFMTKCKKYCRILAAIKDEILVGACYLMPISAKKSEQLQSGYYLYALAVDKALQNTGIGSQIVNEVKKICNFENKFVVLYPATKKLITYYEKLGFSQMLSRKEISLNSSNNTKPIELKTINCDTLFNARLKHFDKLMVWDTNFLDYILEENIFTQGFNFTFDFNNHNYYLIGKKKGCVFKATETNLPPTLLQHFTNILGESFGCSSVVWNLPCEDNDKGLISGMTYNLMQDNYFMNFVLN